MTEPQFFLVEHTNQPINHSEFPVVNMSIIKIKTEDDLKEFLDTHVHIGPDTELKDGGVLKRYRMK